MPISWSAFFLTSKSSRLPCKLATVRSRGINRLLLISWLSFFKTSAKSFGFNFRFLQTSSSASCIYIPADTGMVVDIWTVSVVSATRILRKIWGPWLEEGPREEDNIGVVPNIALVLGPETEGGRRPPPTVSASCFFRDLVVRDGRRWILLSSCWFWCTVGRVNSLSLEQIWTNEPCVGVASKTAYASKLNFEIFPVRSGARCRVSTKI